VSAVAHVTEALTRHPLVLPFCTLDRCCDQLEREEVADLKAANDVFAVAPLLEARGVCPLCLRPDTNHSIHCLRHHDTVPMP